VVTRRHRCWVKQTQPQPLLLSLNAISIPNSDLRATDPLLPSPTAPTYRMSFLRPLDHPAALPITPLTPTFVINVPAARRRKMAKVTHTLGEKIPMELVFSGEVEQVECPSQWDSCSSGLSSFLSLSPYPFLSQSQSQPLPAVLPSSAFLV
jgi:hypothetical protein